MKAMLAAFGLLGLVACASGTGATPGSPPDAGTGTEGGTPGCTSAYATGPGASAPEWCAVDKVLSDALASANASTAQLPGFALEVVTFDAATGEPVVRYSRAAGTVSGATASVTAPVHTASAAKLMTALLIARAAEYATQIGGASLSPRTTVGVLGCTGLPAGVSGTTLDDLMHQIAGLSATTENPCVTSLTTPLHDCACSILQNDYLPGQAGSFAYTAHDFVVSAAIANAVLEKLSKPTDIRSLFDTWLAELGVSKSEAALAVTNNFAGGGVISAHAYATLLALALPGPARGQYHGKQLLDPAILDRLSVPNGASVAIAVSPYIFVLPPGLPMRYGFGDWVQCSNPWPEPAAWPSLDRAVFSLDYANCPYRAMNSMGKFGYMPWFVARTTRPYAAVLAVDLGQGKRVSVQSFAAYEMLDPLIRAAIDASP